MDFKEKLQYLRKQNSLTQEELAEKLFISRTAVSKWETGKGYPNLESLQAISGLFSISINDLLSCEELVKASEDEKKNLSVFYSFFIFITIDLMHILLMVLPLFANESNGVYIAVNFFQFECYPITRILYYITFIGLGFTGLLEILFYLINRRVIKKVLIFSLIYGLMGLMIMIISKEPYVGAIMLIFTVIKILILTKAYKK